MVDNGSTRSEAVNPGGTLLKEVKILSKQNGTKIVLIIMH